ncbi:MAG: DUF3035 domain-containing protein [Rhodospirillales bacterium]|nr:DUF3035 domain-containing protein [Alphaproteobacteria bacterium]MCB9986350.1 DUF3035 domain-containing protein [Rhodospirillales bacterium]USO07101.1 MAG: DUF3035 domain-containing protein [Rhodospirillales bacterium]
MMIKNPISLMLLAATMTLAACGGDANVKQELGLQAAPPDEFSVVTRAPLSVPPDYTLRPPRPGEDRPMEISVREQTKQTVFGVSDTKAAATQNSGTNGAFLSKLGVGQADPNIRSSVNTEVKEMDKKDQPVVERLLFWKEKTPPGKTIDPVEEQKRLQAEGATDNGTTTIEKRNEDILQTP